MAGGSADVRFPDFAVTREFCATDEPGRERGPPYAGRIETPRARDPHKRSQTDQRKSLRTGRCGGVARDEAVYLSLAHHYVGRQPQDAQLHAAACCAHPAPRTLLPTLL